MATTTVERTAPQTYLQGVAVPVEAVNPDEFFKRTQRKTLIEQQRTYDGQAQEVFELRKSDILSGALIRFTGQLTITGGTAKSSARWPYDLISVRFTANGQSNLINCSGAKLKIRDVMKKADLTDRGVVQKIGGVDRAHGTLARSSESWGVGSQATAIAAGTYDVELEWWLPVAEDDFDLYGSIFLATTSSDLSVTVDFRQINQLVAAETASDVALAGKVQVITTKYSIPVLPETGQIVVPDLSMFHSIIESSTTNLQNGEVETPIIGQGAQKSLLRIFGQVWNGAGFASAPLPMSTANFGRLAWRYGNNDTPEEYFDGRHMRVDQERRYNCDVGAYYGVFCHDFVHENAFRDVIDLGTHAEFRLLTTLQSSVSLASAKLEYVQETAFRAGI
jgi:hypothetical protein